MVVTQTSKALGTHQITLVGSCNTNKHAAQFRLLQFHTSQWKEDNNKKIKLHREGDRSIEFVQNCGAISKKKERKQQVPYESASKLTDMRIYKSPLQESRATFCPGTHMVIQNF